MEVGGGGEDTCRDGIMEGNVTRDGIVGGRGEEWKISDRN